MSDMEETSIAEDEPQQETGDLGGEETNEAIDSADRAEGGDAGDEFDDDYDAGA